LIIKKYPKCPQKIGVACGLPCTLGLYTYTTVPRALATFAGQTAWNSLQDPVRSLLIQGGPKSKPLPNYHTPTLNRIENRQ